MSSSNYWIGPYGILVPNDVLYVVAADGINTLYIDGSETEMATDTPLSEEEYKKLYARFDDVDNQWYSTYKVPSRVQNFDPTKPVVCFRMDLDSGDNIFNSQKN